MPEVWADLAEWCALYLAFKGLFSRRFLVWPFFCYALWNALQFRFFYADVEIDKAGTKVWVDLFCQVCLICHFIHFHDLLKICIEWWAAYDDCCMASIFTFSYFPVFKLDKIFQCILTQEYSNFLWYFILMSGEQGTWFSLGAAILKSCKSKSLHSLSVLYLRSTLT